MITFDAAFEAMRAAERVAQAHGLDNVDGSRFDASIDTLVIVTRDASGAIRCKATVAGASARACETTEQLVQLVEREVSAALTAALTTRNGGPS